MPYAYLIFLKQSVDNFLFVQRFFSFKIELLTIFRRTPHEEICIEL